MKYKLSNKEYWISWLNQDIRKIYYKYIHKFNVDYHAGTLIPVVGKGKYVSVYSKGEIIQLIDETNKLDEIRIIPYQPNHGVMIERIKDGNMIQRIHFQIEDFNNLFK